MQENKPECQGCAVQQGYVPVETLSAEIQEPRTYWDRLCKLPTHSFMLVNSGVKRIEDSCGNWLERAEVQAIVDDAQNRIAELEAQLAAVQQGVPSDAEIGQAIDGFDWEGWIDQRKALRTFVKECLQRFKTTHPTQQGLDADAIERAAKTMAEAFDYPWEFMPEQGKSKMREDAKAVLLAAQAKQGGA